MFARPRRHIAVHILLEVEGVYDDGFLPARFLPLAHRQHDALTVRGPRIVADLTAGVSHRARLTSPHIEQPDLAAGIGGSRRDKAKIAPFGTELRSAPAPAPGQV